MRAVTVNDVLDGHVALDIECLDRIYLNAYVPTLQTSAQVAAFLTRHLGFPFPSPALFKQLGDRFRRSVRAFADTGDIPWVTFDKHDNKLEVMRPHLARQAATGRSGVAAVGVAQEFQRVWTAYQRQTQTGAAQFSFTKGNLMWWRGLSARAEGWRQPRPGGKQPAERLELAHAPLGSGRQVGLHDGKLGQPLQGPPAPTRGALLHLDRPDVPAR